MHSVVKDLQYAFRMLVKTPGATLVAVFALTLGISANTAIFSVVNGVLLRPLAYPDPDRLVMLWETKLSKGILQETVAPPNYKAWVEQSHSFEHMAAYREQPSVLTGGALPERIDGAAVAPAAFPLLGASAYLGRTFLPEEGQPGRNHAVLLSYGLWQRRFGGDPSIAGRALTLDGASYTVVGVMGPNFRLLDTVSELWTPYALDAKELDYKNAYRTLKVIARLKPGVSMEPARQEMQAIARGLEQQYPDINAGYSVNPVLLRDQLIGNVRPTLVTLVVAVCFVLLIACSNVANLLLVRAAGRQKEIAIRAALGASQYRIIAQTMTESLLLSLVSGALAIALAYVAVPALVQLSPGNIPRSNEIALDGWVLAFTLAISVAAAVFFGAGPAITASRAQLNEVLKAAGRTSMVSLRTKRLRNTLVVAQVALSVALLIGAGLMIRTLLEMRAVNPGFRPDHVVTMQVALPDTRYEELRVGQFYRQLLERVQPLPGVQFAAVARNVPLGDRKRDNSLNFEIEHRPVVASADQPRARYRAVSADYFSALGIPLIKGRFFLPSDAERSPSVAIINELMARTFWPGENAVGQRMRSGLPGSQWSTIVGIVGNVKWAGLDAETSPEMYYPYLQVPAGLMSFVEGSMMVVIRSPVEAPAVVRAVREQVHAIDPDEPVFHVNTMDDLLRGSVAQPRFRAMLLGVFAAVALALAIIGLYGVISYSVSQRSNEMGIRSALGAEKGDLLRLILGEGARLAMAGIAIGLLLGFSLSRMAAKLLYGVRPYDPLTFVAIPALLLLVALAATYVPALRATRTDPVIALRYE